MSPPRLCKSREISYVEDDDRSSEEGTTSECSEYDVDWDGKLQLVELLRHTQECHKCMFKKTHDWPEGPSNPDMDIDIFEQIWGLQHDIQVEAFHGPRRVGARILKESKATLIAPIDSSRESLINYRSDLEELLQKIEIASRRPGNEEDDAHPAKRVRQEQKDSTDSSQNHYHDNDGRPAKLLRKERARKSKPSASKQTNEAYLARQRLIEAEDDDDDVKVEAKPCLEEPVYAQPKASSPAQGGHTVNETKHDEAFFAYHADKLYNTADFVEESLALEGGMRRFLGSLNGEQSNKVKRVALKHARQASDREIEAIMTEGG